MSTNIYLVDAFTAAPFAGNPAAVCLLPEPRPALWMQQVAAEMNLSETAFLWPKVGGYSLRWFTPATEVKLCGHATLASAFVLWESGRLDRSQAAHFQTLSGPITAVLSGEGIEMDFPALPATTAVAPAELLTALGIEAIDAGLVGDKQLIVVAGEQIVRQMQPDFPTLRQMPGRGVMVTSRAETAEFDFVSRYFAPWVGIDEDPVTGSAHCTLGPYWAEKLGKDSLHAFQASARGGVLDVRPAADRVFLCGQAVIILIGELLV
jgi:PhzF family phenazine biosynthesis protein